jgi:trimeric autotransporter adhesin
MALTGALASTIAASFVVVTKTSVAIADTGIITDTTTDKIDGANSVNDTTTIVTSANGLSKTTSTALGASSPYIVAQDAINLDGSQSDTTTYYDSAALAVVLEQTTINTSWDGRTITTTNQSAYDGLNQTITGDSVNDPEDPASFTPTFSRADNVETDTYVENANGSTTETRSGTGSFGAPPYQQTETSGTNADSSQTTTILNYDALGNLIDQTVAEISPDALVEGLAFDTTGHESNANLTLAAADLATGAALPTNLLPTDIIGLNSTTLNADGGKTTLLETAYGTSLSSLRSQTTTTTSANGLVATTKIDNDGNGVFEQVDTTTIAPDGSSTKVFDYYGDTTATATTLEGSNTYTTSANGLQTVLITSTGIKDTTVAFADSDGSYEFSRVVTAGSAAATYGWATGSSSHMIDADGLDTWSWNDGYGDIGGITIDVATEQQDITIANEIFVTLLGHPMDDSEQQYSGQYITNGVFDREQQAYDIAASSDEYFENYQIALNLKGTI